MQIAREQDSRIPLKLLIYLPWIICSLAAIFYLYEFILRISPSVMSRELMSAYHLNAKSYGNMAALFYYVFAPMQIVVGLLMDRYGPRRLLTIAALSSSMGLYFFASSHYVAVADFGRLMIGFGSAFAFVGVLKLATIWLPPRRFALFVGATVALGMLGGMIGDLVLTKLVITQGWKLACYIVACCGVLLTVLIFLLVRDKNDKKVSKVRAPVKPDFKTVLQGMWQLMKNPALFTGFSRLYFG